MLLPSFLLSQNLLYNAYFPMNAFKESNVLVSVTYYHLCYLTRWAVKQLFNEKVKQHSSSIRVKGRGLLGMSKLATVFELWPKPSRRHRHKKPTDFFFCILPWVRSESKAKRAKKVRDRSNAETFGKNRQQGSRDCDSVMGQPNQKYWLFVTIICT